MIYMFIPPMYSTSCDSPTLPTESSLCPMALMGYCIHFCVAVIICILVLIGIYLDMLKTVDANDGGGVFNDRKYIPSKACHN